MQKLMEVLLSGTAPTSLTNPGPRRAVYVLLSVWRKSTPAALSQPVGAATNSSQGCPTNFVTSGFLNGTCANTGNTVITLPNKQTYTIEFDPNYGTREQDYLSQWRNSHVHMGKQFTIPSCFIPANLTVMSVHYTYDWPAVKTRIVSYDGSTNALEQDFTYQTTFGTTWWATKTTTVTTKDLLSAGTPSYQTIYSYLPGYCTLIGGCDPLENTIQYKDVTGGILQTVTKVLVWSQLVWR